jgi:hypothetical protein
LKKIKGFLSYAGQTFQPAFRYYDRKKRLFKIFDYFLFWGAVVWSKSEAKYPTTANLIEIVYSLVKSRKNYKITQK